MHQKHFILIFLILQSIISEAQFRTEHFTVKVDNLERSFEIYIPENYSQTKMYPLLFVLHGGGGNAKGIIRLTKMRFNVLAEKEGFIVVYPNGIEKSWNDGARDTLAPARKNNIDDIGFFGEMILFLENRFSIQSEHIFACGISNGGFMVQRLAFELPEKFKAIGIVAANISEIQAKQTFPEIPTSVLFICGTEDPLVAYNGGYVTVFNQKRGKIKSVDESIEIWKNINQTFEKTEEKNFPNKILRDNCTAEKICWQNADNRKINVALISIKNGGHTWPGTRQYLPKKIIGNTCHDFNGCDEIWNFFKSTM